MPPWDKGIFAKRHWKGSGSRGDKAGRIAEHMIAKGTPEGIAIATGISIAKGGGKGRRKNG
jgi:hypothetical protein